MHRIFDSDFFASILYTRTCFCVFCTHTPWVLAYANIFKLKTYSRIWKTDREMPGHPSTGTRSWQSRGYYNIVTKYVLHERRCLFAREVRREGITSVKIESDLYNSSPKISAKQLQIGIVLYYISHMGTICVLPSIAFRSNLLIFLCLDLLIFKWKGLLHCVYYVYK